MDTCKRHCSNCKFDGADPDGDYCVHPIVLEEHCFGLALHSPSITKFCHSPEHPLFEPKVTNE